MPATNVPFMVKHLIYLMKTGKFRTIYNYLWLYLFYWSDIGRFLLNKAFPLLRIETYPPFLEIEVTTRCNLRCIMCEHTYWDEKPKDMTFEEFKRIIDQFPKLKWVGVTGIGESFLNKDFIKMLEYLSQKSINFYNLYDPLFNQDEEALKKIVELGIDHLYISIDAATKETYEKIRVGANFDRVLNNIKTVIRLKKETETRLPIIAFHYIVSKANIHEMTKFLKMVHSLGAEEYEVIFTPLLHSFKKVEDLVVKVPEKTINEVNKKAKELGIRVDWSGVAKHKKPPTSKCIAWTMPFIFATGHVIPCCAGNEANSRNFQKRYSLGNIFEKDFRDIWYGEKYRNFRKMIYKGKTPIQCKNCTIYAVS